MNEYIFSLYAIALIPYIALFGVYIYVVRTPDLVLWWSSRQNDVEAQCCNLGRKENNPLNRNMNSKKTALLWPTTALGRETDHLPIGNEDNPSFSRFTEIPAEVNLFKLQYNENKNNELEQENGKNIYLIYPTSYL